MFTSVPILAYGDQAYNSEIIKIVIFTILTMYSGFFATLIWNDITDADIDSIAHPDRPIPSGRISSKKFFGIALIFATMTFIFAILISIWCFILVGVAALFVALHNKYLKKRIKLLAYSEISSPIQWVVIAIFGFLAIWTAIPQSKDIVIFIPILGTISTNILAIQNMLLLVLFTYFADSAHDLAEGIHDAEGDRKHDVRTYATSFGEKNAARISFAMFFISGILGIILVIKKILTPIFLIPFLGVWIYILYYSYKLLKVDEKGMKKLSAIVGRKGFDYFLLSYDFIFLDVFIHLLL
jgi:geranylgeranylglycerol-phosphate geranylgeranyltransferase